MTRDEIMALPAGRELDALVFEHVIGHRKVFRHSDGTPLCLGTDGSWCEVNKCGINNAAGRYSTDIRAAWEVVVELMKGRKYGAFVADGYDAGAKWLAGFGNNSATADNAPLAICRAALLSVIG